MSDKIIEGFVMLKKQKGSRKNETGSLQILGGHGKKKKKKSVRDLVTQKHRAGSHHCSLSPLS